MKRIIVATCLLLSANAFAAEDSTTIPMKCAKGLPAGYLKAIGNAVSQSALKTLTEAGVTEVKVRVSFKTTLRDVEPVTKDIAEILNGLTVTTDVGEALGAVAIEGSKGSFADDCTYDVKVRVGVNGRNGSGERVTKRNVSEIRISAARVADRR